ncbi:MAG TPA: PAS domain S-box protein [Candidatus Acidoferrales bacterium]|nr:PAS domain S-box protein [Candidatus Acidoferrales bacterium]
MDFLKQLFGSDTYMPHGFCYLWNSKLVWLHVISDSLIALSYFAIPAVLLWFVKKRRDFPFNWVFLLFGTFIVACGTTHLMEVWNLWHGDYWLSGGIKAITAAASVVTTVMLVRVTPKALALPGFEQLLQSKVDLERRVSDLRDEEMRGLIREAAYRDQAALLDLTHDAIFVRDMRSEITHWNRASERLYGWQFEEAAGKVSHKLLRTEFPMPLAAIEAQIVASGSWEGELVHHKRDGTEVIVSSRWALERGADGSASAILESNRDITRSREIEKRFETLLEAAPDAMVVVDAEGAIKVINAQTEKIFGYARAELIGQPVEILLPNRYRSAHATHREGYAQAPHSRAMGVGLELYGVRKDGAEFPVEISLSPLQTEEGLLVSSTIRDVSLRHEATEKIQKLNRALEQKIRDLDGLNKEMETFSYSVSHDLRAPLRHIDGFARILAEEHVSELSAEARHYLEHIVTGANQMGTLIDDLLSLGRVGRREMNLRAANLDDLVRQAMRDLPPGTENRQIDWKIEPLGETVCDPGLVKLVFSNLISNAVKFTRTRTEAVIEVGKCSLNETLAYFVRDNGVGFDAKYADKLFGVFQRLHSQQEFEGTGVGLATVRRVVQRHGGKVWVESELGAGTTFFFTLASRPQDMPLLEARDTRNDGRQTG